MIEYISFADKDINNIETNILVDSNINQIKYKSNYIIDFFKSLQFPVESINGLTGIINFDFPVSSVNGLSGNIQFDTNKFVTSVNDQTGNVNIVFPVSSVNNQTGNINILFPVLSVNNQTGDIIFKISDFDNITNFITLNDLKILSINEQSGIINLKISDLQNNSDYITINNIKVNSVSSTDIYQNQNLLNKDVVIFVPNKISQIENDLNYYNQIKNFIDIKQNTYPEDKLQFISCRLEKQASFIDLQKCTACGNCINNCDSNAIYIKIISGKDIYCIDPVKCINCGRCISICNQNAIKIQWQ